MPPAPPPPGGQPQKPNPPQKPAPAPAGPRAGAQPAAPTAKPAAPPAKPAAPPAKPAAPPAKPAAPRPAAPKPKMKEVFYCPCGAKFNVTGVKQGAKIQCSRCRKVHLLTPDQVKLEKVEKEFVNTKRYAKPAPPPPPPPPDTSQPPEEEVVPARHLIYSVKESLRLIATLVCIALLACFWVPFPTTGGSKMAWQVMSDDALAPGFTGKFLVGYAFVAGLAALIVAWLAKGNLRGGLLVAAAAPMLAVPLFKDPSRLEPITGGGGWLRLSLAGVLAIAVAVSYARVFFSWSWVCRVLMFAFGAGVVALYFLPSDLGAGRTSLMGFILEEAKKGSSAYLKLIPLGIGVFTFFATFLGKGGKWFAMLIVLAGLVWYLLDPLRQGYSTWKGGGKTLMQVFDAVRTPTTLATCALLVVFGLGDWIACTLLRIHILKLQEKRA